MGANVGAYTRGGNPAAMFSEDHLYLELLCQAQRAAIDSDFNDIAYSRVTQMRRIIQFAIGEGSPNNGFMIAQSAISPSNNFKITGGDGTDDGAGRIFVKGLPGMLKADVDFTGPFVAEMKKIAPEITGVSATVLTDSAANWLVNEHAGKTLIPDITAPGTTFTIASNTATAITVTAPDLTTATATRRFYQIGLTTPGAPRTDVVYLDTFLDEQDDVEDPNLVNPDLTPPQSGPWRLVLRQYVRVRENTGVVPANYVDTDGRQHYTTLLATLSRIVSSNILTAEITDNRRTFVAGVPSLTVREQDGSPSIPNVNTVVFPNGTVTDLGGGVAQVAAGGGSSLANVARQIDFTNDIVAITAPNPVSIATDIDALAFPHGSTTGQRFEFTFPDDYDSGAALVYALYAMSSAVGGPNNVVRIATKATIAKVNSGTIDTATYPLTQANLTTPTTTNFERDAVMTLTEFSFSRGDTVAVEIQRIGGSGSDLHTGDLQLLGFQMVYLAQVGTRAVVQTASIFFDTTNTPSVASTLTAIGAPDIATEDFGTSDTPSITEEKANFIVPDSWDGTSDAQIRVNYAMSTAVASSFVRLQFSGEIAVVGGAPITFGPTTFDVAPPNDTNPHRTLVIFSIPASMLAVGDQVTLKIARINTGVGSNHTGVFKLLSLAFIQGQVPVTGFASVRITEARLGAPAIQTTGTGGADLATFPNFAGDFESYVLLDDSGSGGTVKAAFPGVLGSDQSLIDFISFFVLGTGSTKQYQVQVYAEGSGNTPVYDSGTLTAPGSATLVTIAGGVLSAMPTGNKRFFVVVTATLAASDSVSVSTPKVRQE